jgi:DNA-binding MarR family transcriptional regulator
LNIMERQPVSHEVVVTLRRIIRAIEIHSRQLSKRFGLTGPQLAVLLEASRAGAVTIGEIAARVHLSQATVTTIVDRMEQGGLLRRTRDIADKRRVHVALTERAESILASGPSLLQETFAARFGALEEWEQLQILSTLQRVAQMMDAQSLAVPSALEVGLLPLPGEQTDHEK